MSRVLDAEERPQRKLKKKESTPGPKKSKTAGKTCIPQAGKRLLWRIGLGGLGGGFLWFVGFGWWLFRIFQVAVCGEQ